MKTTKREIEAMVKRLAEITGVPYKTDCAPQYGGYNLYYVPDGETCHRRGKYGFDYRKTAKEMYAYMEGLLAGINP